MKEKLLKILEEESFDELEQYEDPSAWDTMTSDERKLLAYLFIMKGEGRLTREPHIPPAFRLASKVAPDCSRIFYYQALSYIRHARDVTCLRAACKALQKATKMDKNFSPAWQAWGDVLMQQASLFTELDYAQEALEKFETAEACDPEPEPEFYWEWGMCWVVTAQLSGEASDYSQALKKFEIAEKMGVTEPTFYRDCGNTASRFYKLMGDPKVLTAAIMFYQKSVEGDRQSHEAHLNLSCACSEMFERTLHQEFFDRSSHHFAEAIALDGSDYLSWTHWGKLLATMAKLTQSTHFLEEASRKFEKAYELAPFDASVLARWGEVILLRGKFEEDLQLLSQGEEKIRESLEIADENSSVWWLYGQCFHEKGRYFDDATYYEKAIDTFQEGLAIDAENPLIWHALAQVYYDMGELLEDQSSIEKALELYPRIIERVGGAHPIINYDWGSASLKLAEMTLDRHHAEFAATKIREAIEEEFQQKRPEADWLYRYGAALQLIGDLAEDESLYEKAVQVLNKVLQIDKQHIPARTHLAVLLTQIGDIYGDVDCFKRAVDQFHIVLLQDPENEIAWDQCGLAYLQQGLLAHDPAFPGRAEELFLQAETKLLQAASLGFAPALYHLACLRALSHDIDGAIHYLERADKNKGLPPFKEVCLDEWLENIHEHEKFQHFIQGRIGDEHS